MSTSTTITASSERSARSSARHIASRLMSVGGLALVAPLLVAAPASAAAEGVVTRFESGLVTYVAASGQVNDVQVFLNSGDLTITDTNPLRAGAGCSVLSEGVVHCGSGVTAMTITLGDLSDELRAQAPIPTNVLGGSGDDVFHAGLVAGVSTTSYGGDTGNDTVSYASADRFVTVTMGAGTGDDGRPGDRDTVGLTIENLVGSALPDRLTGSDLNNQITGGAGADTLVGGGGDDDILEGVRASGADDISGGSGDDSVVYSERTADVKISLDGAAGDGETGEGDNVRPDVEDVLTGSGDDTVAGSSATNRLETGAGDDQIDGKAGSDLIDGASGVDRVVGGGGNDSIFTRDGVGEQINCGAGFDTVNVDLIDVTKKCENIDRP